MSFSVGDRIRELRRAQGLSQDQLAEMANLNRVTVARYESGRIEPGAQALIRIAAAMDVSVDELLGLESGGDQDSVFLRIVKAAVPIVGSIACGVPITAVENIEGYVNLPEGVQADFALRCSGDSMVPTLMDRDLVLIRQQEDVPDGRIAAVLIGQDATLKRVHHLPDGLVLNPDNQAAFSPLVLRKEQAVDVRIIGLAVGFVRMMEAG